MRKTCLKVPISNFTLATYLRLGAPRAASLPCSNSFLNNFPLPSPANSQQAHATLPPPPPPPPPTPRNIIFWLIAWPRLNIASPFNNTNTGNMCWLSSPSLFYFTLELFCLLHSVNMTRSLGCKHSRKIFQKIKHCFPNSHNGTIGTTQSSLTKKWWLCFYPIFIPYHFFRIC